MVYLYSLIAGKWIVVDMPHCYFPTFIIYRKVFAHIKVEKCKKKKIGCILGPGNE